jgi:hypothetical protein
MRQVTSRSMMLLGLVAAASACSYYKPMPRLRPGTDLALPEDPSIVGTLMGAGSGCSGPDVGPVQVRNGDAIRCTSSQKDTLKATAPAVPGKKP